MFKIVARDGSKGDFFQMTIKARTEARAVQKAVAFGHRAGFLSAVVLSVLSVEEVSK